MQQNTIKLSRLTNGFVIATVITLVMIYARPLLIPFAWDLLIALGSLRFVEHIEFRTKLPRGVVILV
jgi:hypothetical protein